MHPIFKKPLFKYTQRRYGMLQCGKVRIGTLYDFRNIEKHAIGAIGDATEGTSTTREFSTLNSVAEIRRHEFWTRQIEFSDPNTQVDARVSGLHSQDHDSPDYFIYCLTDTPTVEGIKEFKNDICIQISDTFEFSRLITRWLFLNGYIENDEWTIGPCVYGPRTRTSDQLQTVHPVFLKEPQFSYQAEVRLVWRPSNKALPTPFINVAIPEIVGLLAEYVIPPLGRTAILSCHAPKLDDEELLQRTHAFVEALVLFLAQREATTRAKTTDAGFDFVKFRQVYDEADAELRAYVNTDFWQTAATLVSEYINRGLRDRLLESAVEIRGMHWTDIAPCLQRIAELLEIRLSCCPTCRPLAIESATKYRFWMGTKSRNLNADFGRLIREARLMDKHIPPATNINGYSQRRREYHTVSLDEATRDALVWLIKNGGAPPSEVLDEITPFEIW